MLYLIYTAIIFEIIFAIAVIIAIVKFDRNLNIINEYLLENRHSIREVCQKIRKEADIIFEAIKGFGEKMKQKRNSFLLKLLKKFLITTSLHLFLKKYKKQLIYAQLAIIAYETIQNSIKA